MTFKTDFRTSMEDNLKETNSKLDSKLKDINAEIK